MMIIAMHTQLDQDIAMQPCWMNFGPRCPMTVRTLALHAYQEIREQHIKTYARHPGIKCKVDEFLYMYMIDTGG
jgi:hypothetical protein